MPTIQSLVNSEAYGLFVRSGLKVSTKLVSTGSTVTLVATDAVLQEIRPTVTNLKVILPKEADNEGLMFIVFNGNATGALTVIVRDSSDALTHLTLAPLKGSLLVCNGSTWLGFVGGAA